ncbi:uncharacterized protein LOC9634884 isoform X1 [Selaginella moellendorffii]|uniref:uncharacterized protein LOC9634884 isoform X1 n=1 Tax=Selaginella moellendorffii TaxID=88036 RepID=UPI000D1C75C5|nr:uncharacterized protein LOC9634884 isoform X1 [Selaginella moellendorffii]|eukprot:XP_024542984.1 uncharacterized protein LOC9634884 isoform X1 [Selaginella moellendorffii]
MHVKRSEVDRMLDEVDEDKSGEVEYPEFVQIMTTKLDSQSKEDLEEEAKPKVQPLPFQLLAQAYRRKKMMEAVMGGDKAAQQRLRAKADEAESERLAVLAAMEAEKQNPALAYKEPGRVDLQQQKAQLRKMDAGFPVYIADNIDQDVRDALLGVHEVPKFTIKREKPPLVKSSHLPCGRELRPFTLSQHIREVYQAELIDVKKRRAAVRYIDWTYLFLHDTDETRMQIVPGPPQASAGAADDPSQGFEIHPRDCREEQPEALPFGFEVWLRDGCWQHQVQQGEVFQISVQHGNQIVLTQITRKALATSISNPADWNHCLRIKAIRCWHAPRALYQRHRSLVRGKAIKVWTV